MISLLIYGLLTGAQIRPVNVGAKVLASDEAIRCLFNSWTAFCWHLPRSGFPLAYQHSRNA